MDADQACMTMVTRASDEVSTERDFGPRLAALVIEVPVVDTTTPIAAVDRLFRNDRRLRGVIVKTANSFGLLSREHFQSELSGRLGYGRALYCRADVGQMLRGEECILPEQMSLVQAAQRILERAEWCRYEDVIIVTGSGPRIVSVSHVFEHLSEMFRHVALHDPLTGLPNRRLLDQHGAQLAAGDADMQRVAILYIDLDGFKAVNDTFGHRVGDDILVNFAERLGTCVRPTDITARLGGDEFAALLIDVTETQALAIADRIVLTASAPFVYHDQLVHLSATVGVAMATDVRHETELTQLDVLLRHADAAMLKAKGAGKRQVGRLMGSSETSPPARHGLIRRHLTDALSDPDDAPFELHYQPKLDLASDTCDGVEALVRWTDPELGSVSPGEFIPIAEKTDQIHRLGRWVINESCRQARSWLDAGTPRRIAINISPVQLATRTCLDELREAIDEHGVPSELISIEITEGTAVVDVPRVIGGLRDLRADGIGVDLDDFGTGYSTLAMLRTLPLTAVKIDKAFIDDIDCQAADALIVGGIIEAAHALGLTVIAEGVERAEQLQRLRDLGCDAAQGFYIARPMPASALDASADASTGANTPSGHHWQRSPR